MISAAARPYSASATAFQYTTEPAGSVTSTA
jgi:hypothetical protein